MPNTKISALTTATALAGTETFPVVQSTTTKKVTINKLIEDRDIVRFGRTDGVIDRLIDFNGDTVSGNTVVGSWANLLSTYPAASNSGMSVLVENAGNNTVGIPCEAYSNGVDWLIVNGEAVLYSNAIWKKIVEPAATFTRAVTDYTFASANGGIETKITAVGVHGLTTAVAVGAYLPITASTNVGTQDIPWTVGLYLITAIDVDTTGVAITVLKDYVAGELQQPTIALAGTEIEVARIHLPPITDTGSFRWAISTENTGTSTKNTRIRFGDLAESIATADEVYLHTDTTQTTLGGTGGVFNYGGVTTTNAGFHNPTQTSGTGASAGNPSATTTQTNVSTDIIITTSIATANDVVHIRKATFWWNP